jgi:hypothetical protein
MMLESASAEETVLVVVVLDVTTYSDTHKIRMQNLCLARQDRSTQLYHVDPSNPPSVYRIAAAVENLRAVIPDKLVSQAKQSLTELETLTDVPSGPTADRYNERRQQILTLIGVLEELQHRR